MNVFFFKQGPSDQSEGKTLFFKQVMLEVEASNPLRRWASFTGVGHCWKHLSGLGAGTSSVTCPCLAGAFKFFATGRYHTVGFMVSLLVSLLCCCGRWTRRAARSRSSFPGALRPKQLGIEEHLEDFITVMDGSKVYVGDYSWLLKF